MKYRLLSVITVSILSFFMSIPLIEQASWGQSNQQTQINQLIQQSREQARQGEPSKAIETLKQLLSIVQQENNKELEAWSFLGLGFNYGKIQEYPQALESYQQALTAYQEINNSTGVATSLSNIGNVYLDMGKAAKAIDYYQQALKIFTDIGDSSGVERTQNNINEVNERLR